MAFTSLDQVVAALPGQQKSILKASQTSKGAGFFHSLFKANGLPTAGANPAAFGSGGTAHTAGGSVVGAIPWTNPTVGLTGYLARLVFSGSVAGTLILYDRLWSCSGMSGTVATAQTIASFPGLPTRASTGDYVEPWLEWYTSTGATAVNATLAYTNSGGTAGRTGVATAITATAIAGMMIPLNLQAGDTGVRTPVSVTLSASTLTAGNFGLTLLRRIAEIPIPVANVATPIDVFTLGLPILPDDACIALACLCSAATTGNIGGNLSIISG